VAGLTFSEGVPQWVRRLARREYRLHGLDGWAIQVQAVDAEEMEELSGDSVTVGWYECFPAYLNATISLLDTLQNDETGQWVVMHEFLHVKYEVINQVFSQCWNGRKLRKAEARVFFRDAIETLIQRDCEYLKRLRGRRR